MERKRRFEYNKHTHLIYFLLYAFGVTTDQCEAVAVDFPDQAGLFAVPLLGVHQLPTINCYKGLQQTGTWKREIITYTR